ncbi:MAG: tetratricopeptide repeat protein, partial [Xanthomonadales bacterium]|nr:tetratricopeptide repeat protein [Xanthomonadales bacterium]
DRLLLMREQAAAHRACGRAAQAEAILRDLIERQRAVTGAGGLSMMQLHNDLALALKDMGRFREAAAILQQMPAPDSEGPFNQAVIHSNLASSLEDAGDYEQAMRHHALSRQALERGDFDADSDIRRRVARNEARTRAMVGDADRAIAMLEDLRERAKRIDGVESFEYAMVTWQLVLAERRAGHVEGALGLLDEARAAWSRVVPPGHRIFGQVHRLRAALALMQGDFDLAARESADALAVFEASGAPPVDLATVHSEQAEVLRRQGRVDEARNRLADALPVLREAYLPTQIWRVDAERTATALGMR